MKFYKDRLYFTRKSRTVDGPHTEIVLLDDIDALLEQFKTIYCDERPIMLLYSFYLPCYGWQYSSGCATKLCQLADCQKLEINIGYEYVHWEEVPRDLWIPRVHADNRKLSIRNAKNVHVYYDPDIFCPVVVFNSEHLYTVYPDESAVFDLYERDRCDDDDNSYFDDIDEYVYTWADTWVKRNKKKT